MEQHVRDVLSRYWGYTSFRPLQEDAMHAVLSGRDSLVVLPTGGGKSLCFQAPALVKPGLALVVSPLISLMKDQVDGLRANGVAAACYNSALTGDERSEVASAIRQGRLQLLYVSPERLVGDGSEGFRNLLHSGARTGPAPVSFVAIDEAHCISQWGHDFRPDYRQLGRLRDLWRDVALHAFTATATSRVRRDIVSQLGLRDPVELVGSFDRPNLTYRVLPRANLKRQLLDILARHRREAGIIYCTSRRSVDSLAAWLGEEGFRVRPYHAGLTDEERKRNQEAFLTEQADIVVATVAFGMGIHRSDVRFVVHAGAPQSLEHYQQESGRAGRDGLEAECVLIYSTADFVTWRRVLEQNGELTESARTLLRDMERFAASVGCRHRHLVRYFAEAYPQSDCGACDFCLQELEPAPDAVTIARKVLSCVARVEQRFGIVHVTNVLRGEGKDQITARRHHTLTTFGLFRDMPAAEIRGYIEQLTGRGFLRQTDDEFPVLKLTVEGVALLKDGATAPDLVLARQRRANKEQARLRSRVESESWEGVDRDLFERLRAVRLAIARERGVPPYVIFHDTTLREMARVRPASFAALRQIYGVGLKKAEDFGAVFLDAIVEAGPN